MRERRGWVVASFLLLLGAAFGAAAVRQHWLPCRGSMLSGSVLHGYAYGPDFSDACLVAMDAGFSLVWPDGQDPWRAENVLGVTSALLLALTWTVVLLTSRWSRTTRLLAVVPALLTGVAALTTFVLRGGDAVETAYGWLLIAVNATAVVAFVAVGVREEPGRRTMAQVALVLGASTAAGFFPSMADYILMASASDANWDSPPGSGYPTVVAVALLALVTLALTLLPRPPLPTAPTDGRVRAEV